MKMTPKFLADILTGSRFLVALALLALAWQGDRATLPWVIGIVVLAWTGDMVDGALARRGGYSPLRSLGMRDHEIDACLAAATLLYLWRIDLVPGWLVLLMAVVTAFVWWKMRSDWAFMGFNTGSHLVALTALASVFPAAIAVVVGWGAMVVVLGRRRAAQMARDVHKLITSAFSRKS